MLYLKTQIIKTEYKGENRMTKLEELYVAKGQAHTQIEIGQQMLKDANQALSQELAKQNSIPKKPVKAVIIGGKNSEPEENQRDPEIIKAGGNRKSS